MCFAIETLEKNFAKTLQKACEKLRPSQYFANFLNFQTVENPQKTMVFAVLSRGGFAAKFVQRLQDRDAKWRVL